MQHERTPVQFFVIAPAKDAVHQAALEKHLKSLWQQGLLANEKSVQAGDEVEDAFIKARLIVLLLSADFNVDTTCQEQMQRALERQRTGEVKVLPILLRPVELTNAPFAHLLMVPTNGHAVTVWESQDAAWAHIAGAIWYVLEGKPLPIVQENREGKNVAEVADEHEAAKMVVFSKIERMIPALLEEMRKDLAVNPLRRKFILMKKLEGMEWRGAINH